MNPQDTSTILARLADTLESRLPANGGDPSASYTAKLLARGPDAFLKKIGEEATELVMAAKDNTPDRIVAETADLRTEAHTSALQSRMRLSYAVFFLKQKTSTSRH